ncbi:MAG: hypothetical protein L6R39_007316, partial [Caloplaca ligustica]
MLGHFKEAQGASEENDQTLDSAVRTQNYIIKRLEYEYEAMVDANPNTRAWIIATSSLGAGYRALVTHLTDDYGIPRPNIQFKGYTRGGEDPDGSFPGSPRGKAVIQWIHKPDGTGATMNIFAG